MIIYFLKREHSIFFRDDQIRPGTGSKNLMRKDGMNNGPVIY